MKSLFKYVTISIVLSAFITCSDDDETTPSTAGGSNTTAAGTALEGKWNAFEFKGNDGMVYGLNQMIPLYDSSSLPGCVLYKYRETILEFTFEFKSDATGESIYRSIEESRASTVNNASTCDVSYDPWDSDDYSQTSLFMYTVFSNIQLGIQASVTSPIDTFGYSINAGILTINDFPKVKFRK